MRTTTAGARLRETERSAKVAALGGPADPEASLRYWKSAVCGQARAPNTALLEAASSGEVGGYEKGASGKSWGRSAGRLRQPRAAVHRSDTRARPDDTTELTGASAAIRWLG